MTIKLLVSCKTCELRVFFSHGPFQSNSFQAMLPVIRQKIIDSFTPEARDLFRRQFDFFDKVTSISGVLFPLPKEERRAGIKRYSFSFINLCCSGGIP